MTDGSDRTDDDRPEDEGVLDPDDLDIRERREVEERDDGRYVISTEGGGAGVDGRSPADEVGPTVAESAGEPDAEPPLDALAAELDASGAPYGLALAGKSEDGTANIQFAGTDPADVLGAAVRWYAGQVGSEGDVDATVMELLEDAGLDFDGE
ncbi:DUF7500 family protein [Halorarum salinum]|uniref:Uncharacterized protein n=1 Tax=Halorarum salinum TaxID=2743089 RepID=A0A7D5LA79_9EURY|nr:hypothetical protein [Halobaculum salinum]QLG61812.1 hypothetical protein HUG12_08770 [Halobaculum salinum]